MVLAMFASQQAAGETKAKTVRDASKLKQQQPQ